MHTQNDILVIVKFSDYDTCGILYWLASGWTSELYLNPTRDILAGILQLHRRNQDLMENQQTASKESNRGPVWASASQPHGLAPWIPFGQAWPLVPNATFSPAAWIYMDNVVVSSDPLDQVPCPTIRCHQLRLPCGRAGS